MIKVKKRSKKKNVFHCGAQKDRGKQISDFKESMAWKNECLSYPVKVHHGIFYKNIHWVKGVYIYQLYMHDTDLQQIIRNMEEISLEISESPISPKSKDGTVLSITESQKYIWHVELKYHVSRTNIWKENKAILYSVIWSKYSKSMQYKLMTESVYILTERNYEYITLLKKTICIWY